MKLRCLRAGRVEDQGMFLHLMCKVVGVILCRKNEYHAAQSYFNH